MMLNRFFTNKRFLLLAGLLCFFIHSGFIVHHTYYSASKKNTRIFPNPPAKSTKTISIAVPERWHNFLDLNRWDSAYYEQIVKDGYNAKVGSTAPFTIMWYPGYPLIAKPIHVITGWQPTLIFSILSALFTLPFWLVLWTPAMHSKFGTNTLSAFSALIICWPAPSTGLQV